jgi:hypothetical protein
VAFLGSTIKAQMWVGMIGVILGLAVVGLTDIILNDNSKSDINAIIAGKLLMDCCLTPALAIFQHKAVKIITAPENKQFII